MPECDGSKSICVIGASRGLGRAVAIAAQNRGFRQFMLVSRNAKALEALENELTCLDSRQARKVRTCVIDFSKELAVAKLAQFLSEEGDALHSLAYCAGGGGYGPYEALSWESHSWTLRVNLLAPAELIHWALNCGATPLKHLVIVGSGLADQAAEPQGASYAAAKSGLRALVESVGCSRRPSGPHIQLFRPGFLDTALIPKDSWPRCIHSLVESPSTAAHRLLDLVSGPQLGG